MKENEPEDCMLKRDLNNETDRASFRLLFIEQEDQPKFELCIHIPMPNKLTYISLA